MTKEQLVGIESRKSVPIDKIKMEEEIVLEQSGLDGQMEQVNEQAKLTFAQVHE